MFANDIVLKDNAAVDHTFKLIELNGASSDRIDAASSRALPLNLRVKRTLGNGAKAVDRFLVQVVKTVSTTSGTVPVICNITLQVPRDTSVTSSDVKDIVAYARNFMVAANVDELLLGSV